MCVNPKLHTSAKSLLHNVRCTTLVTAISENVGPLIFSIDYDSIV